MSNLLSRIAIKLSLITGRSRKRRVKANIKRVKTLLLMRWNVRENILANHETAVCIYNQQIIQRHWNNIPQALFCFSFTHKICKKIPYIQTSHTPLFLFFLSLQVLFICYEKDSKSKLAFVNMDHQKHSKYAKNLHLRWICRSGRKIITVTSECSGSCLYWNSSSKSANLVLMQ